MMMSLTPEKRAELRRMGKEKMDANAAKQADTVRPQSIHPAYPVENGFEAEGRRRIERVEREMREEEAAQRELAAARYELETAEGQRRQAEDEVLRLEGIKNHFDILLQSLRQPDGHILEKLHP